MQRVGHSDCQRCFRAPRCTEERDCGANRIANGTAMRMADRMRTNGKRGSIDVLLISSCVLLFPLSPVILTQSSKTPILEVCKARHAYATTVADQMAFAAGDLLHIVQKNGGWWKAIKVSNPAEQGWVPSNYLSVVKADGSLDKVLVTPRTQAGQVRPETIVTAGGEGVVAAAATSPVAASASSSAAGIPSTNGQPFLYAVRALHKYSATRADGLSFDAGEVMSVVDKKDGWLRAFNAAGSDGWVPSNYTTQIEGTPAAAATPAAASPTTVAATAASAASEDEDAAPAPRKLKSLSMTEEVGQSSGAAPISSPTPRPDVPPLDVNMTPRIDQPTPRAPDLPTDSQVAMTPRHALSGTETPEEEYRDQVGDLTITPRMQASIGVATERVRALYNFEAKKADHLSFKKGDVMVVLKKKAGWWKVHHEHSTGKLGYIPSNYVKALVETEPIANPTTTTILAAAASGGGAQTVTVPLDFEPTKDRPLLVKASHNYKALANNQLSFSKGDLLHVIHKNKGWWKSYRTQDSEKIGYIPSNYVKIVGPGEVPASASASASAAAASGGEGAVANGSSSASASPSATAAAPAAAAAAPAPVVMEEIAIALHDLDKKDPKCLALKRDERFTIHDKNVGGGWWRCTSLYSGDTGLVPSNFLRTEMAPARAPPPLPPARGSIPNAPTFFVEGTYDFTAKKSSQLSYKKHDILVVIKKDGSWWKVRNKVGKEGMIPFNYCKEVPTPPSFLAVYSFQARNGSELSFTKDEILSVQDLESPGWWGATNASGAKGFVPSTYLHPISARVPGMSAPPTPRSAIEPDVPATPRNPDGTLRADPAVGSNTVPSVATAAAVGVGAVVATPVILDTFKPLVVQSGSVDASASANHARALSGSISASPVAHATTKDTVQFQPPPSKSSALGSVTVPPRPLFNDPAATPRPDFISDQGQHRTQTRESSSAQCGITMFVV